MLSKKFLKTVSEFILSNKLLDKKKKHLVALSGGSDSVCLTLALKDLGYNIELAHCNFHLRKEESLRDEEFCREFALKEGLDIHVAHFDTIAFAKGHKISIEMAARELRYSYFENLRKDLDLGAICVAHHRDDSIETFLLNLMRGTGINGLLGIRPKNGYIVRPLLSVWHSDIEKELKTVNQEFVTDSTNLKDDFTRNKIRLNILPEMKKINPSVKESIYKTLERTVMIADAYSSIMKNMAEEATLKSGDTLKIKLDYLRSSNFSQGLLFYILSEYSFTPMQTEQAYKMINSSTGKRLVSSKHQLLVDREYMIVERRAKN
ncbi:MAG: tRNA lysidine(34) synthetase TilS, partial [Prevotella sp.]|nr:tRNA lysidine(34) synthetase TilS [Prevotella sp.]